jgi:hypothetical protein
MRIQLAQEGGVAYFPRLAKPAAVDVEHLAPGDAAELKRLVEAARFFERPPTIGTPSRGAADYQRYTLTIEDGDRRHTVRVLVPIQDQALLDLVHAVQRQLAPGRTTEGGTPGRE